MNSEPQIIQRPRKWPRYLGLFLALLVVLYFVVTSAPFLRRMVLPEVETAIGCKLEVGDLSLSPFSQLELRNVKVTPNGAEPLAQIDLIRLRYSLWALIGGKIQASEITIEKPVVTLVEKADGSRNLPKLPPREPKPSSAIDLDLHQIQLRNGSLSYVVLGPRGPLQSVTVAGLNVSADQVVTAQPGKLTINGQATLERVPSDKAAGKLGGEFNLTLGPDALPKLLKGALSVDLSEAVGAFREASGLSLALEADVTETDVRDLRLAFRRSGQELGRLRLSGPYNSAKPEARLDYELSGLDRRVLVLLGGALGYDVGETSASAKGKINVLEGGHLIASNGELLINKLSLSTPTGRTPVTDFRAQYKIDAHLNDNAALLEILQLSATDAQGEWLSGTLDRPMNVAWGNAPPGFREARFSLKLNRLRLADWQVVLGTNAPSGNLRADLTVSAERDGRLLKYTLGGVADQLQATVAGNQLRDGTFEFSGNGTFTDFNTIELSRLEFNLKQAGNPVTVGTALADWQLKSQTGGAQANLEGEVAPLLGLFPVAGLRAESGRIKINAQANQKEAGSTASLILNLERFNGRVQDAVLSDYQASVQLDANKIADVMGLQRFRLTAGTGTASGGSVEASGRWDLTKRSGSFDYQIAGLNQSALEPWLASALKPNQLQAIAVDASGRAQVDLSADTSVTSQLKVSDLRVKNLAGKITGPLEIGLNLEASGRQTLLELKRGVLQLGATDRAKNELLVTGRLDLATNNPTPSTLSLRSDSLDLTPFYNLMTGGTSAPPVVAETRPEVEPAPVTLPLAQLTVDLDITKLHLGAVRADNWKGRLAINRSVVTVKPFELTLNGSPVSLTAELNLGVPGWQYDWNFTVPNQDLAPWVDSFQPDYSGKVTGQLTAQAAFKGAGLTGHGLRDNLKGSFNLYSTNLNIDLAGLQDAKKRQLAAMASRPKIGVLSLVGQAFGGLGSLAAPSWYEEISRSPVNTLVFRGDAANGRIEFKEALIQSPVLRAQPSGGIAFANTISDSQYNVPVALSVAGNVARQLGVSAETNAYVALSPMLSIGGTIGKPEVKVDRLAVASLLAKSSPVGAVGGLIDRATGGRAGAVVDRVGGILNQVTGNTDSTPAGGTATSATNAAPRRVNPLDLLNNLTRPRAPAPNPAPAAPAVPAPKK